MNNILLIAAVGVGCLVIITTVVLYDFVQKQQALNKLDSILNPPEVKPYKQTWTYDACYKAYYGPDKEKYCGKYR